MASTSAASSKHTNLSVLDEYLKNIDEVPATVRNNLLKLRHLDSICQTKLNEAQTKVNTLINSWKTLGKSSKRKNYEAIEKLFDKIREVSEEKIQLAEEAYELVDQYIIKLDRETEKFNIYAKKKIEEVSPIKEEDVSSENRMLKRSTSSASGLLSSQKNNTKKSRDKRDDVVSPKSKHEQYGSPANDMPVDPNEPTYCVCGQVSFGQMIMCDNKNCPIEWFHFQCVNLNAPPRGKWFCDRCIEARRSSRR